MQRIRINVQGHSKHLYYTPGTSRCGTVSDGIAFAFGDEGVWVISLEELRGIVQSEYDRRAALAAAKGDA